MTSHAKVNSTRLASDTHKDINKNINSNTTSKKENNSIAKTVTVTTSGKSPFIENPAKAIQATDTSEGQQSDKNISSSSSTKYLSMKFPIKSAEPQTEKKVKEKETRYLSDSTMKESSTAAADVPLKTKQEDHTIPNTEKSIPESKEHGIKEKSSFKEDAKNEMKQEVTPGFPPPSNLSSATNSSESIPTTRNIDSITEDHETPSPADNQAYSEISSTNGATLPVSTTTSSTTQTGTNSPTSKKPANQSASFIHKLYAMLEDSTLKHIIWWHTNETSFFVSPSEEFSKVLSTYFKHANVASFIRQLNMYGFHKVNDSNTGNATSSANEENNSNSNTSEETSKDPVNSATALTSANLNSGSRSRKGSNSSLNGSTPIWEFRHSSGWFKHGNLNGLNLIKRRTFKNTTTQREVHNVKAPIPPSTSGISASNIPASSSHQNGNNGEFPDYRNDIQTYTPYHFNPMTPNSANNEYYEGLETQQQQQQQKITTQQQQQTQVQGQQHGQLHGQQTQNLQQQPQGQQHQGQPPHQIQVQQVIQQQPQDQDQVIYDVASSSNYNSPQNYPPDVQSVKSEVKSRMGSAIFQVQQMPQQYSQQLQQGQPQLQDQRFAEMTSKFNDLSRNYDSLQRNYELVNEELKMVNYDCVSLLGLLKDFVSVSQNTPPNEAQEESYSRKKKLISLTDEFDKFKANILQRSAARDMALKQAVHTNHGNGYYNTDFPHFNPQSVFRHNSNSSTGSVQSNINPSVNYYRAPSQQIAGPNDEVAFSKEIRFNSISSFRSRNLSVMDPLQPVHANVVLTPPQISQVGGPLQQYPSHGSISGVITNGEEQRNEYMIPHGGVQSYPSQQQQQTDHHIAPQRSGTPAMQPVQQQITSPISKDGRSGIPNQGGPRVYPQMEGQLNPNVSALRNTHSLSAPSSTGQIPVSNGQVGKGLKSRSSSATGVNYPQQASLAVGVRHAGSFAHHLSPGNQQGMPQQAVPALEQTTKHHSISTPSGLSLKSQPTTPLHHSQQQQQQQAQQQPTGRSQTPTEDGPDMFDQRKRLSQTNSYSFNNPPRSLPLKQEPARQQVPSIQTLMSSNGINDQSMKHSVSQAPISRHNSSGSLTDLDNPTGKSTRPSIPHNASQYFSVHASNSNPVATTAISQEHFQDQEQQQHQSPHEYPDYSKDTDQHVSHSKPQQIPQPYRHITGVSSSHPPPNSLIPPTGVPSYAIPMASSNSVNNNSSTSVYSLLNHKREPTIQLTGETEKRSRIV